MAPFMFSLLAAAAVASATPATLNADRASHEMVLTAHAEGAQIYACKAGPDGTLRWSFREPTAALIVAGKTAGRHYAGPHWALDDGSLVQGKAIAMAPGATSADVPLLKLAVIGNSGSGTLASATLIYRANTHGGMLAGACPSLGMLQSEGYSADYVFAR